MVANPNRLWKLILLTELTPNVEAGADSLKRSSFAGFASVASGDVPGGMSMGEVN